jgi:adenylyltransferase/sulfurtransferase
VLPGLIGTIQATETLKLILGQGTPLLGRLLLLQALEMRFREIRVQRDPDCPLCGNIPMITQLMDYAPTCTPSPTPPDPLEVDVQEMQHALDHPERGIVVLDVREPHEHEAARIPGTVLLPLSQLPHRWSELDPTRTYYLHCKMGGRSLQALHLLRQHGFNQLRNVRGGILAWAEQSKPNPNL